MRFMNLRAAQVADELGVEHLDLMPLLEPSLGMYYDFAHFTPAGAAVVAAAVAKRLLEPHSWKTGGRFISNREKLPGLIQIGA